MKDSFISAGRYPLISKKDASKALEDFARDIGSPCLRVGTAPTGKVTAQLVGVEISYPGTNQNISLCGYGSDVNDALSDLLRNSLVAQSRLRVSKNNPHVQGTTNMAYFTIQP